MFNFNLEKSSKVLLISNLFCIILAIIFNYDFLAVIWAFWLESIIIGLFTFFKLFILGDKFKAPMRIRITGQPAETKMVSGIFFAVFFAFHYGFFHFVYFFFLLFFSGMLLSQFTVWEITSGILLTILMGAILFFSHLYSFYKNIFQKRKQIKADENFVSSSFVEPYSRIIPIHITVMLFIFMLPLLLIGGMFKTIPLLMFMILKTVADLYAHQKKHKLLSKSNS